MHGGARKGAGKPRRIIRLTPDVALLLRDLTLLLASAQPVNEPPYTPDEIVNAMIQDNARNFGVAERKLHE